MTSESTTHDWPARARRVIVWGDLYLVDRAAAVPWVGFAAGLLLSPIIGHAAGISSAIVLANIVALSSIIGIALLIRMLQKRKIAGSAYLAALSAMLNADARRPYEARLSWHLKRSRRLTRTDAIDTYRAALKDARHATDNQQADANFIA
jgi:hypothetical protein